jgi:coenzyme PQQ biosynthesis protein PqqD
MSNDGHPRLTARARLRFDRHAGQWLLLYPERGLVLNESAAAVIALFTGDHAIESIVTQLLSRHPTARRRQIERDVHGLLKRLTARRLVEVV